MPKTKGKTPQQTLTDAHWDAVWARLKNEGRVEVIEPRQPFYASSSSVLNAAAANPGATIYHHLPFRKHHSEPEDN